MSARLRAVPETAPRAVLYLRQSVARDDSISIELQEIAGRDYCAAHGYEVVAVEVDEGISGRTWSKRPAVQRVMEMIDRRDADVIVLWKWSRLSRSRKDWALAADRVDVAGGRIESATEPIDTATASGRFARGVMTEYAAFQSEQIGEQWNEVRARRVSMGLPPTGSVPWGWINRRTHIEPDPEKAPYIVELYDRYLSGQGFTGLAAWLNRTPAKTEKGKPWLQVTVRKLMDSPIHAGYVIYRGEVHDGAHEGIISETTWARYQRSRSDRHVPVKIRDSQYLLSSLIACHCGMKRHGKRWRAREDGPLYYSYACPSTVPHPPKSKTVATWKVDGAVAAWLTSLDVAAAPPVNDHARLDVEHYAREITALERRLVSLTEHLVSGLVPEATYRETRDKILADKETLTAELARAERERKLAPADYLRGSEQLLGEWETLAFADKQGLVRTLIESVTVLTDHRILIRSAWGDTSAIDM